MLFVSNWKVNFLPRHSPTILPRGSGGDWKGPGQVGHVQKGIVAVQPSPPSGATAGTSPGAAGRWEVPGATGSVPGTACAQSRGCRDTDGGPSTASRCGPELEAVWPETRCRCWRRVRWVKGICTRLWRSRTGGNIFQQRGEFRKIKIQPICTLDVVPMSCL